MADVTVNYKGSIIAELNEESTKTLKTSGKYCEGDITISYVPPDTEPAEPAGVNCKIYEIALAKSSGWVKLITLDSEVLEHINDPKFTVLLAINDEYTNLNYSGSCFMASNTAFAYSGSLIYGYSHRQSTSANSNNCIYYPANNTDSTMSLGGFGCFRVNGSDYYLKPGDGFIRGGTYRLIFTW